VRGTSGSSVLLSLVPDPGAESGGPVPSDDEGGKRDLPQGTDVVTEANAFGIGLVEAAASGPVGTGCGLHDVHEEESNVPWLSELLDSSAAVSGVNSGFVGGVDLLHLNIFCF